MQGLTPSSSCLPHMLRMAGASVATSALERISQDQFLRFQGPRCVLLQQHPSAKLRTPACDHAELRRHHAYVFVIGRPQAEGAIQPLMFLFPRNEVGPHLLAVELATTLAVTLAHTNRFDHAATGHYCCFPFTATVTSFPRFLSTTRARMSKAHLHWLRLCHSSGKCPKQAGPTKPAGSQASMGCSARSVIYVCTFTRLDSLHP